MAVTNEQISAYLAANPGLSDVQIAEAMTQHGVTPAQMAAVTGLDVGAVQSRYDSALAAMGALPQASSAATTTSAGALTQAADNTASTANNVLGGVILAGDSWLSDAANTRTIGSQIGQDVTNVAVGGSTTSDTLNQLNSFIGSGGTFAPGSTVMLDIGGNDLLQGASTDSVRNNLQQIVSTLGNLGVNVVLSGAPAVGSVADVTGSTNLAMSNIFNDVAAGNQNVTLVDAMSGLLNQKNLVDDTGFHMNEAGRNAFNAALSNAYLQSQGRGPIDYSDQAIRDFVAANNLTADQAVALAPSFGLTGDRVRGALAAATATSAVDGNTWDYNKFYEDMSKGSTDTEYLSSLLNPLSTQNPDLANNARNIFDEITNQQTVTGDAWASGRLGSKESAALDYALRLAEAGVTSLSDIKKENYIDVDGEGGEAVRTRLVNSKTGEVIGYDGAFTHSSGGGNRLGYALEVTDNGIVVPYTVPRRSGWMEFREGTLKPALSLMGPFIPGAGPFIAAGNAINAANKGDWGTAVVSALTAVPGFNSTLNFSPETLSSLNTAKTAGQVLNAIDKGNPVALANTLMQTDVGKDLMQQDMGGGISLGDVVNTAKIVQLANTGNYAEALASASELTKSPNLNLAASALNLAEAISTGDPFRVINSVGQLDRTIRSADQTVNQGNLTNRVYDDTIVQAGADAFIRAKQAGASDEDAMAASDAATGVIINAIPDAGPSNAVSVTYGQGGVDTNFGDLEGAIATNAANDARRIENLDRISSLPRFADAFAQARSLLGPNQTFTWKGKEYSTATFAERPDLGGNVVPGAASTTAGAGRGSYAGYNLAEDIASKVKSTPTVNEYGGPTILGLPIGTPQDALNTVNRMGDVVLDFSRGIGAGFGNFMNQVGTLAHIASASISGGDTQNTLISKDNLLSTLGKDLAGYYNNMTTDQSQKEWKTFVNDVSKAPEYLKPFVALQSGIQNFGGVVSALGGEVGEEVAPLLSGFGIGSKLLQLGASGTAKSVAVASTLGDMAESAQGSYDNVMKGLKDNKNMTDEEKHWKATQAAAGSMAATAIFGYGANSYLAKSIVGDMIATPAQKVMGPAAIEYITEYPETFIQSLNDKYAIKGSIDAKDISEANTDSSIAALLGTKTAGTITGTVQVVGKISNEFVGAGSGEKSGVAIIQSPSGQIGFVPSGDLNVGQELDADNLPQIEGAADLVNEFNFDPDQAARIAGSVEQLELTKVDRQEAAEQEASDFNPADIDINAALQPGSDSDATIGVQGGVQVDAQDSAQGGVSITTDPNTGAKTTVDSNTGVISQTTINQNNNTQTTTTADTNNNTTTQTVVDPNTNTTTSVTVDSNNNTTTQTTINADTQTTVLTDTNTNTQTTVVINANTGEVIDVKEGEIPPEWKQPVIEAPSVPGVPGVPGTPSTTPTVTALDEDAATRAARLRLPQAGDVIGGGRAGLPSTIDISGEALRSRVTQGQIDPLARVKEAQAELEREVMMNQIDPRLLSVMQQRMGADQQNPQQQFESDIGALARMLRGEPEAPANENKYYSYGSEDSIDDILGGKAANYAAGGYVEPLKASGGSMALPLLAKSGGALDKYHGRENFKQGKHVAGEGDGQSDDIPAWLADGEFVFPADVVSALGNGSTKAGTDKLYEMMHNIRERARSKGPKDLPPPAFKSPLDYLKSSKRSTK